MLWQPTLSSDLLKLRPLLPSDWDALYAAASDPLVWALHPEPTRHQADVFRNYFDGALESHGALVVEDVATGSVIGSSRFTSHREESRSVEIGYTFLVCTHWGGATNRDLKTLMLSHAFTLVDTVWFVVGEKNWRSRRAMEKIGGTLYSGPDAPRSPAHVVFRIDRPRVA